MSFTYFTLQLRKNHFFVQEKWNIQNIFPCMWPWLYSKLRYNCIQRCWKSMIWVHVIVCVTWTVYLNHTNTTLTDSTGLPPSMPIADQCQSKFWHWSQCRSMIGTERHWALIEGVLIVELVEEFTGLWHACIKMVKKDWTGHWVPIVWM